MTTFYEIGADGNYRVPYTSKTMTTHGQRILKVGFVAGDRDVVVVAERGVARGPAALVLPQALRRALAGLLKPVRARMLPTEFQTNDKTYDTGSTVDDPFKPKQDPVRHPKEEAVRQMGKQSPDLHPSEEDPQIQQKLKDESKLMPVKEKEVRTSAADNWDLDAQLRKRLDDLEHTLGTEQRSRYNRLVRGPDDRTIQSAGFPAAVKKALVLIDEIEDYLADGLDDKFAALERVFKEVK